MVRCLESSTICIHKSNRTPFPPRTSNSLVSFLARLSEDLESSNSWCRPREEASRKNRRRTWGLIPIRCWTLATACGRKWWNVLLKPLLSLGTQGSKHRSKCSSKTHKLGAFCSLRFRGVHQALLAEGRKNRKRMRAIWTCTDLSKLMKSNQWKEGKVKYISWRRNRKSK